MCTHTHTHTHTQIFYIRPDFAILQYLKIPAQKRWKRPSLVCVWGGKRVRRGAERVRKSVERADQILSQLPLDFTAPWLMKGRLVL